MAIILIYSWIWTEDAALQQDSGIEEMDIKIELDASQFDDSWVERDEHRQQKKPKGKVMSYIGVFPKTLVWPNYFQLQSKLNKLLSTHF